MAALFLHPPGSSPWVLPRLDRMKEERYTDLLASTPGYFETKVGFGASRLQVNTDEFNALTGSPTQSHSRRTRGAQSANAARGAHSANANRVVAQRRVGARL